MRLQTQISMHWHAHSEIGKHAMKTLFEKEEEEEKK